MDERKEREKAWMNYLGSERYKSDDDLLADVSIYYAGFDDCAEITEKREIEFKEKIRVLSNQGGHTAWERDELRNALQKIIDIYDHSNPCRNAFIANDLVVIARKALEDKDE